MGWLNPIHELMMVRAISNQNKANWSKHSFHIRGLSATWPCKLVGRSLVVMYTRGKTRTLFDMLQKFLRLVGDLKILEKDVLRVYAAVIHLQYGC